jgi:glutamate-1-semialdehyde 2,1-aminomutase
MSAHGVLPIHGHDHPKIREAIADALTKGTSFGTPGPAEVEMAELICEVRTLR